MMGDMTDEPGANGRVTRALAAGLFGLALAETATAVACGLAGGISWAGGIGSFALTDGIIGLALSACGVLLAWAPAAEPDRLAVPGWRRRLRNVDGSG